MEELLNHAPKRDRLPNMMRWTFAGMGVIFAVVVIFVVIDQLRNEVVVINNRSTAVGVDLSTILPKHACDLNVPAHSKVAQTLYGSKNSRILFMYDRLNLVSGRPKTISAPIVLPQWGNRIVIIEDELRSTLIGKSTLRQWIDTNRNWIPLPGSWMY